MTKKRFILIVMVAMVIVACAKQAKAGQASEWRGLSESEVRSKLDANLPGYLPDEKRSKISDKVVAKMRARGVLGEDADETVDSAETAAESTTASAQG